MTTQDSTAPLGVPMLVSKWLNQTFHHPKRIYGPAALRLLLGTSTSIFIVGNYSNRRLLWGPHSIAPIREPSPFQLSNRIVLFEVLFHACLLCVVAFAIFGGRLLAIMYAIAVWSIHNQNGLTLDGGNNLVQLIALLMPFMITSGYWSPLAERTQRHIQQQDGALNPWSFGLHNVAVALAMFQTGVVYMSAGLWKVAGEAWRHGIALDIVAASPRFGLVGQLRGLMGIPVVVTLLSYGAVIVQLVFVPLVLSRRSSYRLLAVVLVASMHAGIIMVMGLVAFGVAMLGADSVFLTDCDYEAKLLRGSALRERLRLVTRRVSAGANEPTVASDQ